MKRELIKTELLKEGFLREIALSMDNIMSASIENATKQGPSSAQERKTLFQIVGLLEKDTFMVSRKSLADIVEEIEGEN